MINRKLKTISVLDIANEVTGYLENSKYYETIANYFHNIISDELCSNSEQKENQACLNELRDFLQKLLYCADAEGKISVKTIGCLYKEQIKDIRNSYAEWPESPSSVDLHLTGWQKHDLAMQRYTELQDYGDTIALEKVMKFKHLTLVK